MSTVVAHRIKNLMIDWTSNDWLLGGLISECLPLTVHFWHCREVVLILWWSQNEVLLYLEPSAKRKSSPHEKLAKYDLKGVREDLQRLTNTEGCGGPVPVLYALCAVPNDVWPRKHLTMWMRRVATGGRPQVLRSIAFCRLCLVWSLDGTGHCVLCWSSGSSHTQKRGRLSSDEFPPSDWILKLQKGFLRSMMCPITLLRVMCLEWEIHIIARRLYFAWHRLSSPCTSRTSRLITGP